MKKSLAFSIVTLCLSLNAYAENDNWLDNLKQGSETLWQGTKEMAGEISEQVSKDSAKAYENAKQAGKQLFESGASATESLMDRTQQGIGELKEWANKEKCQENSTWCFKQNEEQEP
ncbi:hypothetical protein [Marinomonas epiphytica]